MTSSARSVSKNIVSTLILLVVLGMAIGVTCIWCLIVPTYQVASYIRVAPAIRDIVSGEPYDYGISDYERFRSTQAMLFLSTPAGRQNVVDELIDRGLQVSQQGGEPHESSSLLERFKQSTVEGACQAEPVPGTDFISVSMTSPISEDAQVIVDAIVRSYLVQTDSNAARAMSNTLAVLAEKKQELLDRLKQNHRIIRNLREYGRTESNGRESLMAERTNRLSAQLFQLNLSRMRLETRIQMLERGSDPNTGSDISLEGFRHHVNRDPLSQEFARRIVALQIDIITAKLQKAPGNPVIYEKEGMLSTFAGHLEERRGGLKREYARLVAERADRLQKKKVLAAQAELELLKAYEAGLHRAVGDRGNRSMRIGNADQDVKVIPSDVDRDAEDLHAMISRIKRNEMQKRTDPLRTDKMMAVGTMVYVESYPMRGYGYRPRWTVRDQDAQSSTFSGPDMGFNAFCLESDMDLMAYLVAAVRPIDQDGQAVRVGNTNLDLQDIQFEIDLDTADLEKVIRRIREVEMRRQSKPLITLSSNADIQSYSDPRWKLTLTTVLSALGLLLVLSIMRGLISRQCSIS